MRKRTRITWVAGILLVTATTLWPTSAAAQGRHGRVIVARGYGYGPWLYDPFWGPFPYYGSYPIGTRPAADVRVIATPKQAEVYVDGFYAGVVDDFDGVFQRLETAPGGHAITLHLEGYRTVTQNIYVTPNNTFKLQVAMDKLGPGQTSDPVPLAARRLAQRSEVAPPVSPA